MKGCAKNAVRFSAMARDGDGRWRDLVDMRVQLGWIECLVVDIRADLYL